MLKHIKSRFALSSKGAIQFINGVFFTTLLNITLMLPTVYLFIFLDDYLNPLLNSKTTTHSGLIYYIILAISFIIITWLVALQQYRSTFSSIYEESANRRISLAEKLRRLPLSFFGEKNLSDLTSTIMDDNTELEHTFSHAVPQLFASVISILLIAIGLFVYNWTMALSVFWVVPLAASVIICSKKKLHKVNKEHYLSKREVSEKIQEGLENIQEIKSYNGKDQFKIELDEQLNSYEKLLTKGELLAGTLVNGAQSLLKLGTITVILVGATLLINQQITLFMYLMFLLISASVYQPINDVFNNLAALFYLDIRINRMNEMEALPVQSGETTASYNNFNIEFNNVDFSYNDDKQVLNNVSFTANQGEITALIGPSGGGKSTCTKLAARFWDVDSGAIKLGDQNIQEIDPETLLKEYSIVFQNVVLFNTTIKDNIRIGKRDATDEEIIKAARSAQCEEFIENLPNGYNTVIGENGATLSGGERQRLSIARALLKDAPIVLLDEATASLDVENETKIQAAISKLIQNKTVLIIAHRMRTIANADKIVVLTNGKVVECGSPNELKRQNGHFSQMLKFQQIQQRTDFLSADNQ
ncbi:ABC transporter ATP-binding protein [Puteibacter caeruleilacunae]|nr:ABC transporter ATP-binding protein [Puteibacter caeruleilacunae]